MAKPKKATQAPKATQPAFSVSIDLRGQILKGQGPTLSDAIAAITPPHKFTTRGVITVETGGKRHQQILQIPRLKRLFYSSRNMLDIQAKQLATLMKPYEKSA